MNNNDEINIWDTIADKSNMEDDIIDELLNNGITKEQLKEYLNLPLNEFEQLPKEIKEACLTDELLEEFDDLDEVDNYHQRLFMRMISRKYPSQIDRVRDHFNNTKYSEGKYGEKRYKHQYHKRNVPVDYDNKAKFIFNNLKLDISRYNNCIKVKNGKKCLVPVGMSYDELMELASNLNCLSKALKNSELKQYRELIIERFYKGISIRDYAKIHNIAKGSVEHNTKKALYIFAGLLARYDLAQIVFDEIFEEDTINLQEIEDQSIKDQIFTLIESSRILNRKY